MLITSAKEIGKVIQERRKKLGYTQSCVAENSGFSVSFIAGMYRDIVKEL